LDWGYVGSGPDDLALNTLLLISDPAFAKQWHQLFTVDVIQYIPYEGGSVPIEDIRQWVQAKQKIVHI
jgi:hypothetical protein